MAKLVLMACVTLMAMLCELCPAGILPQLSRDLAISEAQTGNLVSAYAVASALFGVPLVSLTVSWNRKTLLCILLAGFSIANILIALAPTPETVLAGRVLSGACAGTTWPMITAYGMSLVDKHRRGQAVCIIMSGITVGMSLGIPLMTLIGVECGWRSEFFILGALVFIIACACALFLPSRAGEKQNNENSCLFMLQNKGILLVLLLTFLVVGVNYGIYTYITRLIEELAYPGILEAQIFFGVGSVVAIVLAMKWIDDYLLELLLGSLVATVLAFAAFFFLHRELFISAGFLFWGIGFGALSSLFQTACARQVHKGVSVANSLQSCAFNLSIMAGAAAGGILIEQNGAHALLLPGAAVIALAMISARAGKRYLA